MGGGGGGGGEGRVSIWGAFGDVYVYIHTHISQFQAQFECFQGIKGQFLVSQPNHLHPLCAALTTY